MMPGGSASAGPAPQSLLRHTCGSLRARRVSGHGFNEAVSVKRPQLDVGSRGYRGGETAHRNKASKPSPKR